MQDDSMIILISGLFILTAIALFSYFVIYKKIEKKIKESQYYKNKKAMAEKIVKIMFNQK